MNKAKLLWKFRVLSSVTSAPEKEIIARVECDTILKGRPGDGGGSGGTGFGVTSSVPALVS